MTMQVANIHQRDNKPPLIFLADEEDELQRAWDILTYAQGTDSWAENHGEVWQYMGTSFDTQKDGWQHTFRHRCHPQTNERIYVHVPARLALTLNELGSRPASYTVTTCSTIGLNNKETVYGIYTNALLIIYVEEHGARIHYREAQLLTRRFGHRFLPESIKLAWAAEYATPEAPAFVFHTDPVDDEVFTYFRRHEIKRAEQTQCPNCGSGRTIQISETANRWYCKNCQYQAQRSNFITGPILTT